VLIIDIIIVLQTFFIAYLIRFNFTLNFNGHHFLYQIPLVAVLAFISILLVGSHKGIIRHTGIKDAHRVFVAVSFLAFISIIIVLINRKLDIYRDFTIPLSIIAIHYLLNIVALISSRFVFKQIFDRIVNGQKRHKNILIYGAGDSGLITASTITNDKNSGYQIIGFIDDNPTKKDKLFNRIKVHSSKQVTEHFINKFNIQEIIISIQNISSIKLLEITDNLVKLPVKVKIVPPIKNWIDGDLNIKQIKEVKIEDLLERNPIKVENPILQKEFNNKTILITGAAGSIGSEIAKQISTYSYKKLIILDQAESDLYELQQDLIYKSVKNFKTLVSDIRNNEAMDALFKSSNIDIVFHAAAYKHVPLMEENPYEAIRVNVRGTKIIMDLSAKYHAEKFVMVSTDKAVNPTNVMGATKRIAEMYASCMQKTSKTKFITTRFGNVLGSNGSVIPLFKKQIIHKGPLTVTHKEITRYFMTIPEACQLVLEAGAMGKGGEIFVFDMGESVKIFELAKKMIRLSGFDYPKDINIEIIGLRPGEKLFEELLGDSESTLPTYHEKIMIAKVNELHCNKTLLKINTLSQLKLCAINDIVSRIKKIVPEYISQNSQFEVLDK
jgi:FlaA1/EpsC-like NDP-sugar epimerase